MWPVVAKNDLESSSKKSLAWSAAARDTDKERPMGMIHMKRLINGGAVGDLN